MRRILLAWLCVPHAAIADELSLSDVSDARNYVLRSATCSEISALFDVPEPNEPVMPQDFTVGLLFASTLIEGVAQGRAVPYGELLVSWAEFCAENPKVHWREFE